MLDYAYIPTATFVLVAVRLAGRFLLVQERKEGQAWYLPAGRVEPGETLARAAYRETLEEAGLPIILEGVIRLEHSPGVFGLSRLRVIFVARPAGDHPLKSQPDVHSLQARWVSLADLDDLPLRDGEVRDIFRYLVENKRVYPLDVLASEGTPLK